MARRGEDLSFDEFFLEEHDRMVRSLTLITGDAELAADCVQDAFVRAYARWKRISTYDSPASWVRRVAINRSRDLFRSAGRRRNTEESAAAPDVHLDPEPLADHDLLTVLSQLPDRQRIAVTLYYLEGLSVDQVADSMGITSGAVKYHLNRGRAHLAPLLAPASSPTEDGTDD
ncbi:MAG: SigE family RNA polymerase sigma factor [Actinomycetia bacterium]|nr:SigE family RNA polymerase sigma factor [Actinomycetes bacterium]MCP3911178.1 SigE family RNA polymerase sigma factor [Actinomycetes bacterium]MCP4087412.1 SigE family RNA polymerase sigma factor [Actinomycetes bacterium]